MGCNTNHMTHKPSPPREKNSRKIYNGAFPACDFWQACEFREPRDRSGDAVPHRHRRGLEQDNARLHGGAALLHHGRKLLANRLRKFHRLPRLLLLVLRHHYLHHAQPTCGHVSLNMHISTKAERERARSDVSDSCERTRSSFSIIESTPSCLHKEISIAAISRYVPTNRTHTTEWSAPSGLTL